MKTEQEMLELVLKFAKEDERIRAVFLYGSKANPNIKKDNFQDYDISFVVTETESFQANKNWINIFGEISLLVEGERNALVFFGNKDMSVLSRRCVFNVLLMDNNCLDLVVEVKEEAKKDFSAYKPNIILIDKDNFLTDLNILSEEKVNYLSPDESIYHACCSNFWWFLLYSIKGIARKKIPSAMVSYNTFSRTLLNRMVEWYINIETNFSVSIGKCEKNYEKYLPKDIYDLFSKTYTEKNYWDFIFTTCELFNKLALFVGKHYNFKYNQQEEDSIINYINYIKKNCIKCPNFT